jgi:eukaryotic-like serine/threonine-protein kinase
LSLAAGTKLGPYEILAPLGAGGMGEVYRARDTKLGREVALKVLPQNVAGDSERMARFKREAQVLASLNHPNIATIHGLEESGGVRALVMELVEGVTLAERIKSGAIPLEEALPIARQIAAGLEDAHERGIIHRDLKPANIKITAEGAVKILDFGLAKALESAAASRGDSGPEPSIEDSPTLSSAATQAGVILGTAAYMSPEQAKGKKVDRRADIWAFGVVLFETLTGRRLFEGDSTAETLATVMMTEPKWESLPADVPPSIRKLLSRCLEKDPKRRLQAIGEARIAIEETLSGAEARPPLSPLLTEEGKPEARGGELWRRALPWALAAFSTLVLITLTISYLIRTPRLSTRAIARLSVALPPSDRLALGLNPVLALSPDGSRLVYVASHAGAKQLYVRPIDSLEANPIPGTEGAESPFFSPDGQSVGFFAEGKLKRVSFSGGAPLTLCTAASARGASWGPDDAIVFTPSFGYSGLFRVSAGGGTPKPLTTPDQKKGEVSDRWPQILPDGKAVLFTSWSGGSFDDAQIAVQLLETGERRTLLKGGSYARYVPSGHLVYARAGGLLAVPFDVKRLEVTGPPVSIPEGVSMHPTTGSAEFSSSNNGSLVYFAGGLRTEERTLLWVDRRGTAQTLPAPPHPYFFPRLSPDGLRLAVGISGNDVGVWVYDLARGVLTRVAKTAIMPSPAWTPDGKRLTFNDTHAGPWNLYWMPADGSGTAERLTTSENGQSVGSWSPDGHVLAFSEMDPTIGYNIQVLKLEGEPSALPRAGRKPQPFLQTPSNGSAPMFSPDGRWLAYQSNESGRNEVYVRPFPGPGGKSQISTEGGTEPVWARNGRELFYRNGDKIMVVAVETKPGLAAAKPKPLFEGQYEPSLYAFSANYDVSADGQRFLMLKSSEQGTPATQINVVLNWFEDLKRRVPTGK